MYSKLSEITSRMEAVSFDIFDTLVMRKCGSPQGVFDIVEQKIKRMYPGFDFPYREIRIEAEKKAHRENGDEEIVLQDIYGIASQCWGCELSSVLMGLETETELEQCTANTELVAIYHRLKPLMQTYIVSDMYLGADCIKGILASCHIELPDRLYVSSEHNATKRNRRLYRLLLEENHINPRKIVHVGDNFISDFINPKLLGMHSFWIRKQ